MPKKSKRVAARQAELSKKKRKSAPRASALYQGQAPEAAPGGREATRSVPPEESVGTGTALPEFEIPEHVQQPEEAVGPAIPQAAAPPRFSPGATVASAPGRSELPKAPYLRSDMRRIGTLAVGLLVTIVVLTLFID
jgi:hypothetical protein